MTLSTPPTGFAAGSGERTLRRSQWVFWVILAVALVDIGPRLARGELDRRTLFHTAIAVLALGSLGSRIFSGEPLIVLDEHGIWDRRWGLDQPIPWSNVRAIRECGVREISLHLHQPLTEKPANSAHLFKTAKSLTHVETHAWGLEISYGELLRELRDRRIAATGEYG